MLTLAILQSPLSALQILFTLGPLRTCVIALLTNKICTECAALSVFGGCGISSRSKSNAASDALSLIVVNEEILQYLHDDIAALSATLFHREQSRFFWRADRGTWKAASVYYITATVNVCGPQ